MQRLLAVLAVAAFAVACSDSSTSPTRLHPDVASYAQGIPPPPPTSGSDSRGFLDAGPIPDLLLATAASTATTSATPACLIGHEFALEYAWSYFINRNATNEWAHIDMNAPLVG